MRPVNELPHDVMELTLDFLQSRFWLEVMEPEIDASIQYADEQSIASREPYNRFGWTDYKSALMTIKKVWLREWMEPLPREEYINTE